MEKRKFQRFPLSCTAVCFGAGQKGGITCRMTDMSRNGIMMCFNNQLRDIPGPNLFLEIGAPSAARSIQMLVYAKWSRAERSSGSAGHVVVGAQICLVREQDRDRLFHMACRQAMQCESAVCQ
jgi:hypothetical protein